MYKIEVILTINYNVINHFVMSEDCLMNFAKIIVIVLVLLSPCFTYAQPTTNFLIYDNTDLLASNLLTAPYDLRERNSYVQISNITSSAINLHIQIFQNDRNCDELNFNDTLTANDTVIYDLDNIIRNDGTEAPINLQENSNGYVIVTVDNGNGTFSVNTNSIAEFFSEASIIGNIRIIDSAGYEYRTNMVGAYTETGENLYANFNTIDTAIFSDVIGYVFATEFVGSGGGGVAFNSTTVRNRDEGADFDIFVYDLAEEPLSCDRRNFACGNIMNYGINEDYQNSKNGPLLCPGGGIADPHGGFILFDNPSFPGPDPVLNLDFYFTGFIGLNNNDGTGSFDLWFNDGILAILQ